MPGGGVLPAATTDVNRIEAPVTWRAYAMCVFASFGGIFFGYDSGYIGGVQGMKYFYHMIDGPNATALSSWKSSLIVSILSAGTFFGAIMAGDLADFFGRRFTIILGCGVFIIGVILQTASSGLGLLVAGRLVAGFGVGFVSAIIILYMSEIAPRKVRGAIVSGYQFCITIGLLLAACVTYGTQDYNTSASYRIPIGLQLLWALIPGIGLFFLPESPRYFVKKGKIEQARIALGRVRGQPTTSEFVETELSEIIANADYERQVIPNTGYFGTWAHCFTGSLGKASSNVRKTILGTSMQMMQQWTGVNFVFYYSTIFLQSTGAISNPFIISLVFTLVNVCSTPLSFWMVERFGRRPMLIWGALGMTICEFIVGIVGVTVGFDKTVLNANGTAIASNGAAVNAQIAFIAIYIFFFATTWGPGAWVVIGEIFPLPIRSRGVALSTASNWLWNCIIAVITPYLVGTDKANLKSKVFFLWGSLCFACFIYAYLLVPETKGLTLEQVDRMLEETTPRNSAKWRPKTTFAAEMGIHDGKLEKAIVHEVEHDGSAL
ncbi:putative MFS monosaccharide transporter [Taphrina deformans PYCC 5710]|uniref:MFS monosaccharide transporter n=1 Tax=Taphrina deformans (strain PYCC 5710 / ATCC 11124 / CBS 356.35 / IMI 108563 / JCM 9778 / NBRC 8474) TaxID=1097556 RepID=R4XAM4_TAPDE|nr:putative MFS monosaccharide transporter [Taphrina deformans PYCC 5710]|eukprot:CCG82889.1 putative MFS monosaccharide transporter [Taphrina deformans PYCC 5710]